MVAISERAMTKMADISFPSTMLMVLIGAVYSKFSVPSFRSSANIRMVRIGARKVNMVLTE